MLAGRSFADWSMGFANSTRAELGEVTGENDFFRGASCLEHIDAGRARKMLVAFGAGRWRAEATGRHRAHARTG